MDQLTFQKRLKQILIAVVLLAVVWIGWEIYHASTFHVITTNPSTKSITTETSTLTVEFNRALSADNVQVTSTPSIIGSTSVSGKNLTIVLKIPLATQSDAVTIESISSLGGKVLKNIHLNFTPRVVAASDETSSQQSAQLQQQAAGPQTPTYTGTDALISNGLSVEQVQDYEQAVTNFLTSTKTSASLITIDTTTVAAAPVDPDNPSPTLTVTFSVSIGNTSYNATLNYSGLTSAELILYNPQTNAQVYDSGTLSS